MLGTERREAETMPAELLGQARQVTGLKQELQSGEGEASSLQVPKVCLSPKLPPCLVCISWGVAYQCKAVI